MIDLKAIRVFLEVSDHRSFVAAAKALSMTPASVTRIISKLEKDLDQQLLFRTTRQVALTSVGARMVARYTPLVKAFDEVARDLEQEKQNPRGTISINAPMSFGLRTLPKLIESFRLGYPNVDLRIRLTDRFVDILSDPCDLAIRISDPPRDVTAIWRKLCEIPMRVVAAPSLLERHPLPEQPSDLDRALCLSYGESDVPETWRFEREGAHQTITAGQSLHTNNGDLLYETVRSRGGIARLPEFLVAKGLASGDVVPVLPDWRLAPLWLSLSYPPYEKIPPLVAIFSEFFEAFLADQDGFEF